ncbi:MAG: molybdenum cofactor biosynthesis protein MoeB [Opitutia bacterium Tous-C1TDCM]|nr:MAG: molybdenum cofactor biosynthesis protein MoeB [Opitutae bacterium Tous-C1TDCM]
MPAAVPDLSPAELARYSRHLMLGEIGLAGQRRLAAARVLIVGAGGLGSPAALYLAAAGIGTLGIADFDRVADHNLQRQLLHDHASVGRPKVDSAADRLRATNPFIRIVVHPEGVTVANAVELFAGYDVIVDGTDNFSSRYLNNDAACRAGKPLVYGSVFKFDGQVSVFDPAGGGPCYRCLFPEAPAAGAVPGCGEAGVLGALCGVIGSLQALETVKLVAGFGTPLRGRLLVYDALNQNFQTFNLPRVPHCTACGPAAARGPLDPARYAAACAPPVQAVSASMSEPEYPLEISVAAARDLRRAQPDRTVLLDVREPYELAICRLPDARAIPLREIPDHIGDLPRDQHLLVLCHHGSRSLRVTEYLRDQGFAAVTNIAGGIDAWAQEIDPSLARY